MDVMVTACWKNVGSCEGRIQIKSIFGEVFQLKILEEKMKGDISVYKCVIFHVFLSVCRSGHRGP